MALEKLPNIAAAYVNSNLEIQLAEDKALDEKAVTDALKKYKISVLSVKKASL